MALIPGVGFLRLLTVGLRLDDAGFSAGLAKANARMSALGVTMGGTASSAGALRGQLTLVGFAALGASAALTNTFSDMERTATIASIAAGEGASKMNEMAAEAAGLGRELREKPSDMLELQRAISFFGLETDRAEDKVAEFSTRLSQITGDAPEDVATNLIRLLNITRRTGETVSDAAERFDSLAGAVFRVGVNVTAGVGDLLGFLEIFQLVGVVSEATENQVVALAGAIADLTPRMREIVTTATQRIFLTEEFEALNRIIDNSQQVMREFPELVELSAEQIADFRRARPIAFFKAVSLALEEAQANDRFLSEMKELGVGQLRSARGLSALIANLDRLDELMDLTADNTENVNSLMRASNQVQRTLSQRLKGLVGAMEEFAFAGGQVLEGVVGPLVDGLTDLFQVITQNEDALKVMTAFLTVIPLGLALGGGLALLRRSGFGGGIRNLVTGGGGEGLQGVPGNRLTQTQLSRLFQGGEQQRELGRQLLQGRELRAVSRMELREAQQRALAGIVQDEPARQFFIQSGQDFAKLADNIDEFGNISDETARAIRDAARAQEAYMTTSESLGQVVDDAARSLDDLTKARAQRFRRLATRSPFFAAVPGEIASERMMAAGITEAQAGARAGFAAMGSNIRQGISSRLARSRLFQAVAGPTQAAGRGLLALLGLQRGSRTRRFVGDVAGSARGAAGNVAGRVGGRLGGLIAPFRFGGQAAAREFAARRAGRSAAGQFFSGGMRLGQFAGQRTFGGMLARGGMALGGTAGRFASTQVGGRLAGMAVPGLNILSIAGLLAPVLDMIGDAFSSLAERGGILGAVFNTLAITFRSAELAGRLFNRAFDLLIDGIGKFFDIISSIPGVEQAFDLLNSFLGGVSGALETANESEFVRGARNVEQMSEQMRQSPGAGSVGPGQPTPDQARGRQAPFIGQLNVEGGDGVDESMRKARDVTVDAVFAASRQV